jgi:hypothetical protein
MSKKLIYDLPKAMPASHDCLPHAAMNLGSARGSGMRPASGEVKKLIIEPQMGNWVLYRLDDSGGFVGDSWHGTLEDAIAQVKKEFGVEIPTA